MMGSNLQKYLDIHASKNKIIKLVIQKNVLNRKSYWVFEFLPLVRYNPFNLGNFFQVILDRS
jgi:hypothetical protein